jgi:Xaa-Pro aminopeptidase
VDENLQRIFDSLPEDAPRSRLEPYRELILRWRRQGRSYRRIRQLLNDECQVKVADMTVHEFVQRRSRPRKVQPEFQSEPAKLTPAADQPPITRPRNRRSPEEIAAMREAASAANHKPVFQREKEIKPLFVYDPSRPLTNKPTEKDK